MAKIDIAISREYFISDDEQFSTWTPHADLMESSSAIFINPLGSNLNGDGALHHHGTNSDAIGLEPVVSGGRNFLDADKPFLQMDLLTILPLLLCLSISTKT